MNTSIEALCDGCPAEVVQYFKYVRNLQFTENPDYNFMRNLFKKEPKNLPVNTPINNNPNGVVTNFVVNKPGIVDWETLTEYRKMKRNQTSIISRPNASHIVFNNPNNPSPNPPSPNNVGMLDTKEGDILASSVSGS